MCHKCEEQKKQLHLSYLKHRGIEGITHLLKNNFLYSSMMAKAALNTKQFMTKVENGGSGVVEADISYFSLIAEKRALDFAEQYVNRHHLEKDASLAKEIENFRAALTLIQSKATVSGDDVVAKIAQGALDNQEYRLTQSSAELKAMLDNHK